MTQRLLRGRFLSFLETPKSIDDHAAYRYEEDGAVLIENGVIKTSGDYATVFAQAHDGVIVNDHRPHLLSAGFIDTHLHYPQMQIIGSYAPALLEWLNTYTFVEEQRFGDPDHAARIGSAFFDEMVRHGTTTAAAYCSVHKASADAFFAESHKRNMRMIGGKVMMDRNAPEGLTDTAQQGYDESKALIARWHGRGRAEYAITPRFAITSSPAQLELAGALVAEHPDCHVQTHLSENRDEIAFTRALYPEAPDYLGVYERFGLLHDKTLLGHSIHLEPREIEVLAETGAKPVFCPTSNLFLGSGLFDDAGLRARGIAAGIATDVGAGTSYSMLQTLNEGYKILQLQGQKLHPLAAFHWITRGNAVALGLEDRIGTLEPGTEADVVVLNPAATEAMALRAEAAQSLSEELFILQIMGDDRAVEAVYVAGRAQTTSAAGLLTA